MSPIEIVNRTIDIEGGFAVIRKTGEVVNRGITVTFLRQVGILHGTGPATADEINYVHNLTRDATERLYLEYFWNRINLRAIPSILAAKVYDVCVNQGAPEGIKLLQQAVNKLLPPPEALLKVDGQLGPKTVEAAAKCPIGLLYFQFIAEAKDEYVDDAKHPNLAENLDGWLLRLCNAVD